MIQVEQCFHFAKVYNIWDDFDLSFVGNVKFTMKKTKEHFLSSTILKLKLSSFDWTFGQPVSSLKMKKIAGRSCFKTAQSKLGSSFFLFFFNQKSEQTKNTQNKFFLNSFTCRFFFSL